MANLLISFVIALGAAAGFVTLIKVFNMDSFVNTVFPFVPFLYAIVYQFLEKKRSSKTKTASATVEKNLIIPATSIFKDITLLEIIGAVIISIILKMLFDLMFVFTFLKFNYQKFLDMYGAFNLDVVLSFFASDHPWIAGNENVYLLMLLVIATLTSMATGLWIGYTTKGNAILAGVLVGSIVTMISSMTNMLFLYQRLEDMMNMITQTIGLTANIGFIAVIGIQVMFYGFWSGIAQKEKEVKKAQKKRNK